MVWATEFCKATLDRDDHKLVLKCFQNKDITFLNQYHDLIYKLLEEKQFIEVFNEMYDIYIKSLMIIKKAININQIVSNNDKCFKEYEYYLDFIGYFFKEDDFIMEPIYKEFDSIISSNTSSLMILFKEKLRNNLKTMTWREYCSLLNLIESKKFRYKTTDYKNVTYERKLRVENFYRKN